MATPPQSSGGSLKALGHAAQRKAVDDAGRARIMRLQVQVQALVHQVLLRQQPATGTWAQPTTEVRPADTVPDNLDELCSDNLRLEVWDAYFLTTTICRTPDGDEALRFAFKILAQSGDLHHLARPSTLSGGGHPRGGTALHTVPPGPRTALQHLTQARE